MDRATGMRKHNVMMDYQGAPVRPPTNRAGDKNIVNINGIVNDNKNVNATSLSSPQHLHIFIIINLIND